jgi:hypothetical protein
VKKLSIKGSYPSTERSSTKKFNSKPILKKKKEDKHLSNQQGEFTIQDELNHSSIQTSPRYLDNQENNPKFVDPSALQL